MGFAQIAINIHSIQLQIICCISLSNISLFDTFYCLIENIMESRVKVLKWLMSPNLSTEDFWQGRDLKYTFMLHTPSYTVVLWWMFLHYQCIIYFNVFSTFIYLTFHNITLKVKWSLSSFANSLQTLHRMHKRNISKWSEFIMNDTRSDLSFASTSIASKITCIFTILHNRELKFFSKIRMHKDKIIQVFLRYIYSRYHDFQGMETMIVVAKLSLQTLTI